MKKSVWTLLVASMLAGNAVGLAASRTPVPDLTSFPTVDLAQVSVLVDGQLFGPEDRPLLNAMRIHIAVDEGTAQDGIAYGFRTMEELQRFVGEEDFQPARDLKDLRTSPSAAPSATVYYSYFFTEPNFAGSYLALPNGYQANLTGTTWDNVISSFIPGHPGYKTCVSDGPNATGSYICATDVRVAGMGPMDNKGSWIGAW